MRHYASVILTAESEIFVATNFMQKSRSLTLIADALRTLSTKVRDRKGKKIVVKCACSCPGYCMADPSIQSCTTAARRNSLFVTMRL